MKPDCFACLRGECESHRVWQTELGDKRRPEGGWLGISVSDGWKDLVLETDALLAHIDPDYKISQIKEKFGLLRYYFQTEASGMDLKVMYAITSNAESRSSFVCELCGKFGMLRDDRNWIRVLCNNCAEENPE